MVLGKLITGVIRLMARVINAMNTMTDIAQKAARSTVSHVLNERNTETVRIPVSTRQRILDTEGRPTAIICWRDETALPALRAAQDNGLRVPEDLSIVGFSDVAASRLTNPTLSTIQSPWESMGRLAVQEIIRHNNGTFSMEPTIHLVPTHSVARQSTGPTSF